MAVFNPLYTGENSSVEMPELDSLSRSLQRKGQMSIQGEEAKLNKALSDKATFQKMLDIDPIAAVSTKNAERQAIELEKYNNKWAERYVSKKGELTFADELEMSKDRKLLEATQGKMLAEQEQYKSNLQTIMRDTRGYYDRGQFEKAQQEYFDTGVLPMNMLSVAPQDLISHLSKLPATGEWGNEVQEPIEDERGNIVGKNNVTYEYKATKEQAQQSILGAMQNEAFLKRVILDFDSLPESEQLKVVGDYNRDGVIDPQDSKYAHQNTNIADNPIARWAMNNPNYLDPAMGKKRMTPKNVPTTKSSTNSGNFVSLDIGMGTPVKYQPTDRQSFKNYKTYHAVPEWPTQNIPADNITVQKPTGEKVKVVGKTLSLQLTGYDEEKDEFTFITKNNYWGDNQQGAGDQIAIARKDVPPKFNDFEILVNGNRVKVGELKRESNSPTAQAVGASGVVWGKKK